jgi:hypothetical protein
MKYTLLYLDVITLNEFISLLYTNISLHLILSQNPSILLLHTIYHLFYYELCKLFHSHPLRVSMRSHSYLSENLKNMLFSHLNHDSSDTLYKEMLNSPYKLPSDLLHDTYTCNWGYLLLTFLNDFNNSFFFLVFYN